MSEENDIINPALALQESDDMILSDDNVNDILQSQRLPGPYVDASPESIAMSEELRQHGVLMPHEADALLEHAYSVAHEAISAEHSLIRASWALEALLDSDSAYEAAPVRNTLKEAVIAFEAYCPDISLEFIDFAKEPNSSERFMNPAGAQAGAQDAITNGILKVWDGIVNITRKIYTALSDYFQSFYKSLLSLSEEAQRLLDKLRSYSSSASPKESEVVIHDANFLLVHNGAGPHDMVQAFDRLAALHKSHVEPYLNGVRVYFDDYYTMAAQVVGLIDEVEKDPEVEKGAFSLDNIHKTFNALIAKWMFPKNPLEKTISVMTSGKVKHAIGMHVTEKNEVLQKANDRFAKALEKGISDIENSIGVTENLPGGMSFGKIASKSPFKRLAVPRLFRPVGSHLESTQSVSIADIGTLRELLEKVIEIAEVGKDVEHVRTLLFTELAMAHNRAAAASEHKDKLLAYLANHLADSDLHASMSKLMNPVKDLDAYTFKVCLHLLNYCKRCMKQYG